MASIESKPRAALLLSGALLLASCASRPSVEVADVATTVAIEQPNETSAAVVDDVTPTTTALEAAAPSTIADDGLLAGGVDPATLITTPRGEVVVQPTPAALENRQLQAIALLPPPIGDEYVFTIQPLVGEPLERSTWNELCPVPATDLRYLTVSYWGFDGNHHTGELIVGAVEANDIAAIFGELHARRFPIEQMRIVTPSDVVARRTGDGNNTASYVCRQVTGGTRFSEHAFGLAIDINPFQNPYQRGDEVIPALSSSYLDRSNIRPGMIVAGDPAGDAIIAAFADAGWAWGGNWNSLRDYQHFALNNR